MSETIVFYDPLYLEHDTGYGHPERAERLEAALKMLEKSGLSERVRIMRPRDAAVEEIQLVHPGSYIEKVKSMAESGGGYLDMDTPVSPRSFEAALRSAGASLEGLERIFGGEADNAFCLQRPPGHHATATRGMGFCLFNNNAVASRFAMENYGVKVMSMGFLVEEDTPMIWRGPMLHGLLTQFLQDADWGELDYLIVDLPPGTGDVAITLSQLVGLAGAVVVCTPQKVALLDAVKAVAMFRQVNIPVLGIVENMSGDVFGRGGARAKAEELGVPFLGEVPILPEIRVKGDEGQIASLLSENSPAREPLIHVCQRTAIQIAKELLASAKLPELEVL